MRVTLLASYRARFVPLTIDTLPGVFMAGATLTLLAALPVMVAHNPPEVLLLLGLLLACATMLLFWLRGINTGPLLALVLISVLILVSPPVAQLTLDDGLRVSSVPDHRLMLVLVACLLLLTRGAMTLGLGTYALLLYTLVNLVRHQPLLLAALQRQLSQFDVGSGYALIWLAYLLLLGVYGRALRNTAAEKQRIEHYAHQQEMLHAAAEDRLQLLKFCQHELGGYISGIGAYVPLLRQELADTPSTLARLDPMLAALSQSAASFVELAQRQLILSRDVPICAQQATPLSTVLAQAEEYATTLEQTHGCTVDLAIDAPDPEPLLAVDRTFVGMALTTALRNAVEAAEGDAAITLRCALDGPYVRLTISDYGPGFPAQVLEHLGTSTSALSTKHGGHGLGLRTIAAVARLHGGSFSMYNNGGAHIEITLPTAEGILNREISPLPHPGEGQGEGLLAGRA